LVTLPTIHHPNLRQVICLCIVIVELCFIICFLGLGYPSSNLPNRRMSSAPSPTIDFSLLTPSTDPSSNFQTGQKQGNCCQGVLVELQNLQKEVRKLCKALQSKSSHTNSRRVLDFHHSFLQNLIDDCPKNSVRRFVDLNTALKDPKLAISMVIQNF
jgi:hypothetical protein